MNEPVPPIVAVCAYLLLISVTAVVVAACAYLVRSLYLETKRKK